MLTLPLNTATWDLQLDSNGNLNLTTPDISIAQDVASAIRTFLGECWFDTTQGLPYFQAILGQRPAFSLLKAYIEAAALGIAQVQSVAVAQLALSQRRLTGAVYVTSTFNPTPITVNF